MRKVGTLLSESSEATPSAPVVVGCCDRGELESDRLTQRDQHVWIVGIDLSLLCPLVGVGLRELHDEPCHLHGEMPSLFWRCCLERVPWYQFDVCHLLASLLTLSPGFLEPGLEGSLHP